MFYSRLSSHVLLTAALAISTTCMAEDWVRFRGPNGTGVDSTATPPTTWSDDENIAWKIDLPGPGSSCPIVVGDRIFVTCWTGYGESREGDPGDQANLERMLLCFDKSNGQPLWSKSVAAKLPEDDYQGMMTEHGYASHTPTSDGERVYAYFGKSGIFAYDLDGNELWSADCGDGFGAKNWGSAASPLLYKNLLLVSAFAEGNALIAFDKVTGEEAWRFELDGLNGDWSTPAIATTESGRDELILSAPMRIYSLDPTTGTELWNSLGLDNDTISASPIIDGDIVYALTGRGGGMAVRIGGEGDVTDTNILWRGNQQVGIPTPVAYNGRIYSIGRGKMNCFDAATGETVFQARLESGAADGGRGSWPRGVAYASPVVADGRLYSVGRKGETYVIELGDEYNQIGFNQLTDGGDFSSTPVLEGNRIYLRSTKSLYCIDGE